MASATSSAPNSNSTTHYQPLPNNEEPRESPCKKITRFVLGILIISVTLALISTGGAAAAHTDNSALFKATIGLAAVDGVLIGIHRFLSPPNAADAVGDAILNVALGS